LRERERRALHQRSNGKKRERLVHETTPIEHREISSGKRTIGNLPTKRRRGAAIALDDISQELGFGRVSNTLEKRYG
jgi:hypothetical protein